MILEILFIASITLNLFSAYGFYKLSRRLFQFDDLFDTLVDDVDTNTKYFKKLLSTDLFNNSEEVMAANKNMGIISQRLEEFVLRINETTGKKKN